MTKNNIISDIGDNCSSYSTARVVPAEDGRQPLRKALREGGAADGVLRRPGHGARDVGCTEQWKVGCQACADRRNPQEHVLPAKHRARRRARKHARGALKGTTEESRDAENHTKGRERNMEFGDHEWVCERQDSRIDVLDRVRKTDERNESPVALRP